jgi:hypothetical protein
MCIELGVLTYGLSDVPECCVVFSLMCVPVFHLLTYWKHHLSVLFCVCKQCAAFLDLCLGVLLLSIGQCHCSVCVRCLCVPKDKL